ncbi:purine-cytosine permease family protein [Streptomyces griseosporeus]|uniref:purine-cytosine permease family protein n=1 Tax=Streptomyces griseosporeus TaxID=1910 RepID=UPI00167F0882|nr:cytosine permease [Streptomyces griseosporeus]GHF37752.1 cytosine permease [Streptomyces griseosporeus]
MNTAPRPLLPDAQKTEPAPIPSSFDAHGVEPIPENGRDSSPRDQWWIWVGANVAPINWVLGALGITLGLNLVETLIVISLGNIVGCGVFGLFNMMGHRTGVNQMVLGRAAFGRKGAVVPGVMQGLLTMGWVGVNTWVVLDLAVALLGKIGIHGGEGLKYAVAGVVMAAQLGLAVFGFYAIRTFERWTVPATVLVMAVMTVLSLTQSDLHWTAGTAEGGTEKVTAVTQLLTAIGIGWGISWVPYSADYSRFVPARFSGRSVFWATALGMYVPTVWLAALGACLATTGQGGDPSELVISAFGVMALPVLLLIMHGPVATNILNLYSCALAALSVGVRAARWKVTLVAGAVATVVLLVFMQSHSFAESFDHWMTSILVWISPWAAVMLTEFFVLRRSRLDVAELFDDRAPAWRWRALLALAAGIAAAWSWQYGLVPLMQGPLARSMHHTDFSWLSGAVVAGGLHYLLTRSENRAARDRSALAD